MIKISEGRTRSRILQITAAWEVDAVKWWWLYLLSLCEGQCSNTRHTQLPKNLSPYCWSMSPGTRRRPCSPQPAPPTWPPRAPCHPP